jgi:hypothetical protein
MAACPRDLPRLADPLVAAGWDCGSAEAWVLAVVQSPRSPEHFTAHSGRTGLAPASGFSRGRRGVVAAHHALVVRRPERLEAAWPCGYCFVRNPHRVALGRSCRIVRVVDRLIRGIAPGTIPRPAGRGAARRDHSRTITSMTGTCGLSVRIGGSKSTSAVHQR